jgi:ribosomal protein L35
MKFRFIRQGLHARNSIKTLTGMALVCALAACSAGPDADVDAPTAQNLAAPLDDYLARRGDICLAMFDWPIDLTEAEAGSGARHAIQFPVMEQLGLVHSTIVAVPRSSENPDGAVKRFDLTDTGRTFYKPHSYAAHGAEHANDMCVAHLKREQIVDVKVDASDAQHPLAVVSYTYQIDTAPWMQNADAQRVFPMIARIANGAGGKLQLRQGFKRGDKGWVAQLGPV